MTQGFSCGESPEQSLATKMEFVVDPEQLHDTKAQVERTDRLRQLVVSF